MKAEDFFTLLKSNNSNFFCGVPDSLLKDFCAYLDDNCKNHIITANEGNAIALACGHYLATKEISVVYMQNSGLGNCINPLVSLSDEEVYNIPILMIIGWRGEPQEQDEPQHIKQGKITDKLLDTIGIDYSILPKDFETAKYIINKAYEYMRTTQKSYALIVRKNTFDKYSQKNQKQNNYEITREEAINTIVSKLSQKDIIISSTGQISRELYECRQNNNQSHKQDFLTVGSMGHTSSIALGVALEKKNKNVWCFDGDGAFLMHMGGAVVISSKKLKNFRHIIFNNESHDSVGAQPTVSKEINFEQLAKAIGYDYGFSVKTKQELSDIIPKLQNLNGTCLLEIKVKNGSRTDLGRPKEKPKENKKLFMEYLDD